MANSDCDKDDSVHLGQKVLGKKVLKAYGKM